jgi:2-oxoglutarate dehydrogenase E2 component (dihydrolipoamide succinyltransferase)
LRVWDPLAGFDVVLNCSFVFQTSVPVPSPGAGVIEERFVEDGATVKAGEKLFKLKLTGIFIVMFKYLQGFGVKKINNEIPI